MDTQYGDYTRVAEMTGYSVIMVRSVAKGRRKNETITNAIIQLSKARKKVAEGILPRKTRII